MADTLTRVDCSALPKPQDDGAADRLPGAALPSVALPASDGRQVALGALTGTAALYLYPMTGRAPTGPCPRAGTASRARGAAHRDPALSASGLPRCAASGATHLFGFSTQGPGDQAEAAERLRLPVMKVGERRS